MQLLPTGSWSWASAQGQASDLAVPRDHNKLIANGQLLSDDGASRLGTAVLIASFSDPDTVPAMLVLGRYAGIEVHDSRDAAGRA